jgi:hypothetical protein|tara:strand:+ start:1299 stop:1472 length:174 start_codon:yes stop_codon:yes gene_type:complete
MSYKKINHPNGVDGNPIAECVIKRISDGAVIPFDEENVDYIEYKTWIDAGNTPQAAD